MVQTVIIPDAEALAREALMALGVNLKTALANCKVALYKSSIPSTGPGSTAATLAASEADYSGYTAGGVTVTAVGDPYLDADTVIVTIPSQQFNFLTPEEDDPVTNNIGGAYVVDAAGKLRGVFPFSGSRPMLSDSNSIVVSLSIRLGTPEE